MEKLFIKNRKDQKLAVVVEQVVPQKGLAFVMHGLGGFKEQPHVQTMAATFVEHGYTAVRFDTTNTFGESDGRYEDATTTNYYEDLENVIAWARAQVWYQEPFALVGHSLGGLCVTLYAQRHPEKVNALAPISTVVSGAMSMQGHENHEEWRKWKEIGWRETMSESKSGTIKRLPWSHIEDRLKYDLLAPVRHPERSEGSRDSQDERDSSASGFRMTDRLTMPVLLVVGENDESCPVEHQKILYAALPTGKKELRIIPGAPHTFREKAHLEEFKRILTGWIESIAT